jgi:hypothetical protein
VNKFLLNYRITLQSTRGYDQFTFSAYSIIRHIHVIRIAMSISFKAQITLTIHWVFFLLLTTIQICKFWKLKYKFKIASKVAGEGGGGVDGEKQFLKNWKKISKTNKLNSLKLICITMLIKWFCLLSKHTKTHTVMLQQIQRCLHWNLHLLFGLRLH